MRVIFMGSPLFAVPSLEALLRSKHEVAAVVTQPDKPVGRGQKVQATPVKERALAAGIPVHEPAKLKGTDFHETLRAYNADVLAVVAYGHILRPDVLGSTRMGAVNVHGSLLPKYRGAAPVQWALINGEPTTGVTIIKLDEGMDTGDMLERAEVDILIDDDAESLAAILSVMGAELLVQTLDKAEEAGALVGEKQNEAEATYAAKLKKEDGLIDWTQPAEKIVCRIKGMTPWPGAYAMFKDEAWRIGLAEPVGELTQPPPTDPDANPGEVTSLMKGFAVVVRAGDGDMLLMRLQPPGKRMMDAGDVINGNLLKVGQRFGGVADL